MIALCASVALSVLRRELIHPLASATLATTVRLALTTLVNTSAQQVATARLAHSKLRFARVATTTSLRVSRQSGIANNVHPASTVKVRILLHHLVTARLVITALLLLLLRIRIQPSLDHSLRLAGRRLRLAMSKSTITCGMQLNAKHAHKASTVVTWESLMNTKTVQLVTTVPQAQSSLRSVVREHTTLHRTPGSQSTVCHVLQVDTVPQQVLLPHQPNALLASTVLKRLSTRGPRPMNLM